MDFWGQTGKVGQIFQPLNPAIVPLKLLVLGDVWAKPRVTELTLQSNKELSVGGSERASWVSKKTWYQRVNYFFISAFQIRAVGSAMNVWPFWLPYDPQWEEEFKFNPKKLGLINNEISSLSA